MRKTIYDCWLRYDVNNDIHDYSDILPYLSNVAANNVKPAVLDEINRAFTLMGGDENIVSDKKLILDYCYDLKKGGYRIKIADDITVSGSGEDGILYGVFRLLMDTTRNGKPHECISEPKYSLRMINHWDNMAGDVERGYSGRSIYFSDNKFTCDYERVTLIARLMASVGLNAVAINNVNVHQTETYLIDDKFLYDVKAYADIFSSYGIKLYLSVNFAAPIELGGLETADPLSDDVINFWNEKTRHIYDIIPDFGGFLVKADSENRPGPFTYGRNHADGANMLANALKPFGGKIIWRCFVYDCHLDWRDRKNDRAKAAYDHFKPLDGKFAENVILQIKNGPMDFQIREATSPLFGAMPKTNEALEVQIAQEYTGQQIDLCYLAPLYKECLDFETFSDYYKEGGKVKDIITAISAVSNLGNDKFITGNPLAAANFYSFGRLSFSPDLSAEKVAEEWTKSTLGAKTEICNTVTEMLMSSRKTYEKYTTPLGIGWMVTVHYHYGPSVDGYEYSPWGTYHYADFNGLGVDRTAKTGTGFVKQYFPQNAEMYENIETCPEELLLFFHHLPYTHKLKSGETIIQHFYNTHFEGVEEVERYLESWKSLKDKLDIEIYETALSRFERQLKNAIEWRDTINTYFYRKSGIKDELGRKIYE